MLSFMREQGPGEQPAGQGQNGNGEAQDFLTTTANSKNLRKNTTVVAILIGIRLV